jgi:NADPH:quinone reductase-like Zn-dependent oxidoreductase
MAVARSGTHYFAPIGAPGGVQGRHGRVARIVARGAIHPVVVDRLPLAAARAVHARIDAGGFGGKIVLLRWAAG